MENLKSEINHADSIKENITFGEWINYWYTTFKKNTLKPKTQFDYENRIYRHIIPSIGNIELKSLSQNDLQQFYSNLKNSIRAKSESRGTDCISKINDNLFEGKYSPKVNGKRITRNVYATTREECEQSSQNLLYK